MKKEGCGLCVYNPALGNVFLRVGVFLLFFMPGWNKFQDPAMFDGMLESALGLTGDVKTLALYAVIVWETVGAALVLLGSKVSKKFYKLAVLGLLIISLVALFGVHLKSEAAGMARTMPIINQTFITLVLANLFVGKPLCPWGITGCCGCGDKK